jgi:hypothetical protein
MWHRRPDTKLQEQEILAGQKKGIPRFMQAILAVLIYVAVLVGISYLNGFFPGPVSPEKQGLAFKLENASALTLVAVLIATVFFMYFLLVKNRKPLVIFICFDCQEPFHAQPSCPACGSANVSDIRLAEWIEE